MKTSCTKSYESSLFLKKRIPMPKSFFWYRSTMVLKLSRPPTSTCLTICSSVLCSLSISALASCGPDYIKYEQADTYRKGYQAAQHRVCEALQDQEKNHQAGPDAGEEQPGDQAE